MVTVSLFTDATEEICREHDHLLLSAIIQASDDAILSKTLDGIITSWNPAAERMFGYTAEEIIGKPKTVLFPPELLQEEEVILDRLRRGISTDHFETVRLHKDGTPIQVSVTISPVRDRTGRVIGASTIARDITETCRLRRLLQEHIAKIEEQNAILEGLATVDGLTGVRNHRALQETLRNLYACALRDQRPLSLLMLDVDRFKQYNDAFGHPAGDSVLREVARRVQMTVRPSDCVARYGGEEFAVLLPDTNVEEAKSIGERIRRVIDGEEWPNRPVTVSVGCATLTPTTTETPPATVLLNQADIAMYRSKNRGRNCVTHFMDEEWV